MGDFFDINRITPEKSSKDTADVIQIKINDYENTQIVIEQMNEARKKFAESLQNIMKNIYGNKTASKEKETKSDEEIAKETEETYKTLYELEEKRRDIEVKIAEIEMKSFNSISTDEKFEFIDEIWEQKEELNKVKDLISQHRRTVRAYSTMFVNYLMRSAIALLTSV